MNKRKVYKSQCSLIAKMVKKKRVLNAVRKPIKKSVGKSALYGAVRDLETEIKKLNKEKSDLKRESASTSSSLETSRAQERALQQRIARIIEKQASLNQKKKTLQVKIDRDADKINKISKIKSEISDI
ncbi:MAG: hypothetical protein Q8P57_03280 [Candidatus Pacearchaeota archaeon]|nr:hypothetical protein [Candidatus Pacearchaeota archaeon]